jgi:hypothetical protein
VHGQKDAFRTEVARRVRIALGDDNEQLTMQIWLLFEGATAAASVSSVAVIEDAKAAALALLAIAQGRTL